ncbi:MAG: hypothetical protein IPF79_04855 [Ignavibacteria bacterium]|nr:hypothetical protein [Ignavibacteria bacterium]
MFKQDEGFPLVGGRPYQPRGSLRSCDDGVDVPSDRLAVANGEKGVIPTVGCVLAVLP